MRIDPLGGESLKNQEVKGKKSKKTSRTGKIERREFFDIMRDVSVEQFEKLLEEAVEEVIESGNELVRSPTPSNLKRYKNAIKEFLKLVEKRLYKLSGSFDMTTGRAKLHVVVEEVNEKLMDLTEKIMKNEWQTINLAARIEEINGLILNLYR
ncbi:YaaR family protein [Thermotoga sp.]|uniref:YaaR family protein n=1 Tax=Thermotoga sp. TaxID=28240 RepID=UPI0025F5EBD2|nr:YaaR family protein [Thermotoga sp.]MCD6551903.1 YaaR family protein [Thermotoga sp.]